MSNQQKDTGELIGWSVPPYLNAGVCYGEAITEACSVVAPVLSGWAQERTSKTGKVSTAMFVFGEELFAVLEPHGLLYRIRYARYPGGDIDALLASIAPAVLMFSAPLPAAGA